MNRPKSLPAAPDRSAPVPSGPSRTPPRRPWRDAALPSFSYAFQPIVDAVDARVVSYEALIQGPDGEPAPTVLGRVPHAERERFDRESRAEAIALAVELGIGRQLNLNMLPPGDAGGEDAIEATLRAARSAGFACENLVVEVTESDVIGDKPGFAGLVNRHKSSGIVLAIDDFGAGHSGLNLLAEFQPDQIKADMGLVRGIETHGPRQAIMRGLLLTCEMLGIDVVAEGVETVDEYRWLRQQGVRLFQGYLFARPGFRALPDVAIPVV
ncbi:MAG: EAL domain-containing protein [Comamonadaceae bacterium]|nr:EAL domain-containing protein [Comamonadaceae bacterium]